ncbi:MAG: flavin reductase family protein [Gemmatimonadetes bacterium]|nr:flavin reductase family protein [Gemmatimonadota bacterium]
MSLDPDDFRALLGRFASGVTVVTTVDAAGHDHGMTVSAFSSVSLDPPLVMVCIARDASAFAAFERANAIVVNILAAEQEALSRRFAGEVSDRFAGLGYHRADNGAAVLHDVLAWLSARVVDRHAAGDHVILVAEVEDGKVDEHRPLLYYRGGYARLER